MRKKLLLGIVIFMAGGSAAFPANIHVVDRSASPDDPGRFEVSVENDQAVERRFRLSVNPQSSWFYIENAKTLGPGETSNFSLVVTPPENAIQQNYRFNTYIRSQDDETAELTEYFSVERENDLTLRSVSGSKNQVDPGESVSYTVEILNTAARQVENYTLEATIHNRTVEKKGLPLSPGSTGALDIEVPTTGRTPPGKTDVEISIRRNGEEEQSVTQEIEVLRQRNIEKNTATDNRILVFTRTLSVRNSGNFETEVELADTLPSYISPITTVTQEPDSTTETEDGTRYTWNFNLEPGDSASVRYTINYWIPLSVLTVLLGGIVVIKRTRKDVEFTKTAKETDDGVKIHLELKNKSSRPLQRVEVEDFIPSIASLKEDFPMAKPVIRKTSNGTRLNWEIDELEAGDQRVFEYSIKPLLEVEGGVTLPEAEIKADDQKISETSKVGAEFQPEDST